ncbi:MAG: hypothetical protein ABIJ34_05025 [archaeon]
MVAQEETKKKRFDLKKIRNLLIGLVVLLAIIKINKTVFFILVFSVLTYLGKQIRGMFGLKMVVLDPLHFSAIMMVRYIGVKEAIILVAFNTLIVDFATAIATDGTFANFFLFSSSAIISVTLLGGAAPVVFCTFAGLLYSIGYFMYRSVVRTQSQFEVVSKVTTSFIFTFLYGSFIGPLLGLLMSV